MAKEIPLMVVTKPAHADYHAYQYYLMKITTAGRVQKCTVAGEAVYGVLQDKPTAQDMSCLVMTAGRSKVVYGDTVTMGTSLTTDSSGRAVPVALSTDVVIGTAEEAGAVNQVGSVMLGTASLSGVARVPTICSFSIDAADIANGDVVTEFVPGFAGTILKTFAVCTKAVSTDSKAALINFEIGTTNVTDGTIALSGKYALGAVVDNSVNPSAKNTFTSTDKLSIEASGVTTFSQGRFDICMVLA